MIDWLWLIPAYGAGHLIGSATSTATKGAIFGAAAVFALLWGL